LKAYVSVHIDEKRSTVTASKRTALDVIQQLKSSGIHVTEVALSGRFHWRGHQDDVEKLISFCDRTPEFQFPDASKMVVPSRLGAKNKYRPSGTLHEIALRELLLNTSEWFTTFSLLYTSHLEESRSTVICFGPERCVPPTIARKLGSRLVHASEIDLSTSLLPSEVLGPSSKLTFQDLPDDRIAVIGMACQLPGAEDLEEFWKILTLGQSQHQEVPYERFGMETPFRKSEANRKWYGNFIKDYDAFDHKFFKKSPREMASTDPQHRVILQLAYQAVEQSGYFRASNANFDQHIGCYLGVGNVDYDRNIGCYPANAYSTTGNLRSFISGKVSHHFGWTGPSLTIDTACSSSSVAVHQACRAIINGECTSALAGGVNILTNPEWFHNLAGAAFLSPTGQCKPFDAKGDGYCRGEGAGVVFLKRLSSAIADGDQVLGVIASTRVYQNQNCTAITVPNARSLSDLFVDVVRQARLEPQNISVVEAHGTGTPVGDPAEYDGIRKVLGGSIRSDTLFVSSVKGLLGHTEFASGIVSLLKILLMINEGFIPPQASFTSINPSLNALPKDLMEIPTQLKPWDAGFRAALINNYGASGSNSSMVITQAPNLGSQTKVSSLEKSAKSFPFWFCGFDTVSLRAYVVQFRRFLQHRAGSAKDLSMCNLSFQLYRQSNRTLPQALILNATSYNDLEQKLSAFERGDKTIAAIQPPPARPVILCFGGQISTYVGLERDIYDHVSLLRSYLDQCDATCVSLGLDSIYPDIFQRSPIQDTVKLQTMLFAMQYSCARAWIDSGVKVAAVVGHSFGELTALCISGVYSLTDGLKLISGRARLIRDSWGADKGAMLAVEGDHDDVVNLLTDLRKASGGEFQLSIACYNSPRSFTLAGSKKAVQHAEDLMKSNPIFSSIKMKKLNVTNAFHSALVDPLMPELDALGRSIVLNEPNLRVERATELNSTSKPEPDFVAQHLRNPVFFNHAVRRLAQEYPAAIWLEAGSNSTVTTIASRALGNLGSGHHFQPINISSEGSFQFLVNATTGLWKEGLNISFWAHHTRQISDYTPIILPPYQFEKSRHWMNLKDLPQSEPLVEESRPLTQAPTDLTTFISYQDETNRSARFRVNTAIDKFQRPTKANMVANATAVSPGMLQLEIALNALSHIRPDFKKFGFQPELRGIAYHNFLIVHPTTVVYLDAISKDDESLIWEWKLHSPDLMGTATDFSSGTIIFRPTSNPQLKEDYEGLSRLSGRRRCLSLLQDAHADDVLQGRNIYRAFEQVVNYKEPFRNVTKIVGKDNESAGIITKAYSGEAWIDPILTECFCQVAGISINLMTDAADLSQRGIFICPKISRWIRNPRMDNMASLPEVWEVFAVHHRESETMYVSDVFAFDSRDGSLIEAILGVSYQKVSLEGLRKALTQGVQSELQLPTAPVTSTPSQVRLLDHPMTFPVSSPAPTSNSKEKELFHVTTSAPTNSLKEKTVKKAAKAPGPDVAAKTLEIVCNLSGLDSEDIKDDSDLVELGIDSLMAMELVREVDAAFKCTLENQQLMDLTDFKSLVVCIRSTLGLDSEEEGDTAEDSAIEAQSNGTVVDVNGSNGTSGAYTPSSSSDNNDGFTTSTIIDVFREIKWTTDDAIIEGQLGTYYNEVMPRSTELCIGHIVNAFEQLGCPIRSATPGQVLERVQYLPKHEKFMNLIYGLLKDKAGLIDIKGSQIIRTAVPPPNTSVETMLQNLIHDEPVHAAEHKLTALVGAKFADLITGKEDGLQLIFGTPESREIASDMYANSPINTTWIKQLKSFLEKLIGRLPKNGEPICILEVGGGTGGTTSRILPMLAQLGVPIKYTMTDISGSLIASARKRFKKYPFMEFKVLNIESEPNTALLQSQHIILATNCIHATRDLNISLKNMRDILRPDGFLIMLEMTEQVPWVDFIFGLLEGWWLFEDGRDYVLQPATYWEKVLYSVGYANVDWTEGDLPEANVQRLIIAHASGPGRHFEPESSSPRVSDPALRNQTEREAVIDAYVHKFSTGFCAPSQNNASPVSPLSSDSGHCVLVTGATGSLGAHIVAYLAQRPDIQTVVCFNRLSSTEATLRQHKSLEMRGISLDPISLAKLKVIETNTSKPMLGLSSEDYHHLVQTVTHIVHSAWPMSLTRPIRTYESQLKIVRNLIDFAREVTDYRPSSFKFGFQFVSSSAVVANYPLWTGKPLVPEQPGTIDSLPMTGYAEAKLVTERILAETLYRYPDRFHAMAVRIAQISGSTSNGYWNPTEYIPFLIKSSQVLKILPDLDGTLSWYPVNDVASTLGELLLTDAATDLIYHIDNPSRQEWRDMISTLARALDITPTNIVPYEQWIDQVRGFKGSPDDNPAVQLIEFFDHYFVPMSCGGLVLDTSKTGKYSKTLQRQGPIDDKFIMQYISRWKQTGFLYP
jgi:acyl transferase domain-containing protein/thioester reductase-like protein/acyl carrier protein/SAM-dependent methyltransferase